MIMVGGPQVMKGYLKQPEKTKQVIHKDDKNRWYITGDKGFLDEDGFLTIVDRYSRFAKLAGEMVSLSQVEGQIKAIMEQLEIDGECAATTIPHDKTGECVALAFTYPIKPGDLRQALAKNDMPKLQIPREYLAVKDIPKLGSGKTNLAAVKQLFVKPEDSTT